MIGKEKASMEKILFCMSLAYIRYKFYQKLDKDDFNASRKYMQWNSDVLYAKQIIEFHTVGYR